MGSTLPKEEEAVVKLLQHILSNRGIRDEVGSLKQLLQWAKERALIPTVGIAFELETWDEIGKSLCDEISKGPKEAGKLATLWRLIRDTLKEMKSERAAAVSVFAPLTPDLPVLTNAQNMDSTSKQLFETPKIPPPAPAGAILIQAQPTVPFDSVVRPKSKNGTKKQNQKQPKTLPPPESSEDPEGEKPEDTAILL